MKKLLIALALWLLPWPVQAAADRCTYDVGNYSTAAQTYLDALRADAFADAYGTYIADLERLRADSQLWSSETIEYARGRCRTYADALATYVQDVLVWEGSTCALGPVSEDMVSDCAYRHSQLDARRAILLDREREDLPIRADLDRRAERLRVTGEPAFEHAATVLAAEHVEDALRLYISWMKRDGGSDSCRSLARIAGQLGERVTEPRSYLEFLARNLVSSPQQLSYLIADSSLTPFVFTATGFKPQFVTLPTDDQVRHAVGYMVIGYKLYATSADFVSGILDESAGQHEDYLLAVEAGKMGAQLYSGAYSTRDFGRAIEERLCE